MDFLRNNKRFSFKIGEKNAWDLNFKSEQTELCNEITTVYMFDNGLKVTNVAKKYEKYGAYEWVNYIENTSDTPTEIISELWDCDCELPIEYEENRKYTAYFPDVKTATKIYAPSGSTWSSKEFYCEVDKFENNARINHIQPGETKNYTATIGRSSENQAPFFNICKNGKGYFVAIGWSGQWNCSISRTNDSVMVKSKIEDTYFKLMPGENLRTSSVVILPYEAELYDAHNMWRRMLKEEFCILGKGDRPKETPISAMIWGGMRSEETLRRLDIINKNDIPFDCIWMDAGWYGRDTKPSPDEFEGDWGCHTGDWTISPYIHPNELCDVEKAVHDSGRKFLLWFEPERVVRTTPIVSEHPEYFLYPYNTEDSNVLLNLGNEDAWNYCYEMLSEKISKLHIDWLRIDFNFGPILHWRHSDTDDRKGISEIKYINGFYNLWDKLLESFPYLLIDNCASGGRRIDIETLKLSVPLWRSDFQCPANYDIVGTQCHNQCFNMWMPYSGTGAGRICDEYRVRSAYSSALGFNMLYSETSVPENLDEAIAYMKKYVVEAKEVRKYLSEDFYPLTEVSDSTDVWCANQFNRPSEKDGMVQIFRRENSPYKTACFQLRGINEKSDYLFIDADGGDFVLSGSSLVKEGFEISISEKRCAKIFFYKELAD